MQRLADVTQEVCDQLGSDMSLDRAQARGEQSVCVVGDDRDDAATAAAVLREADAAARRKSGTELRPNLREDDSFENEACIF